MANNMQEVPTDDLLAFHEFPLVHNQFQHNNENTQINMNLGDDFVNAGRNHKPSEASTFSSETTAEAPEAAKSFWTIDYYQRFFDVDTKDVVDRVISSVNPLKGNITLKEHLQQKPDLYGPFWISITLIFTIAISGNIANYLQHTHTYHHWRYDFRLVSYAATAICFYVCIVPLGLWGLLKWSFVPTDQQLDVLVVDDKKLISVLELICLYGYSLFIYIPISVLWTIQINWLQWILVIIGALVSGSVLFLAIWPAIKCSKHKISISSGVLLCHILLAMGFMLYFFHVPNPEIVLPPAKIIPLANTTISH